MGSIAKKGLQQYLFQLQHHPLRTKAITAGVLSAISDIVAQKLSGIQKLQLRRLLLKVVFGFAYLGPFGHFLHILLDKLFKGKKDTKTVAKKVALEQLTSSPWNNFLFMVYYGLVVEARPWIHVKAKIKKDYPAVQYASWTFWPVVGWVNHQYVPLQFRVIFHSVIACCWRPNRERRERERTTNGEYDERPIPSSSDPFKTSPLQGFVWNDEQRRRRPAPTTNKDDEDSTFVEEWQKRGSIMLFLLEKSPESMIVG